MKKKKKFTPGILISFFSAVLAYIGKLINKSVFLSFFTDYEKIQKHCKNSKTSGIISRISTIKYKSLKFKNKCAKLWEESVLAELLNISCERFFRTNLRTVGVFMLSAGGVILSTNTAENTQRITSLNFSNTFIFGAALFALSLIFLPQKNITISRCICESRILSYFFKDIFYVKHLDISENKEPYSAYALTFIIGTAFGSISYAVSPVIAICTLLIVFMLYLIFTNPENGILLTCLALPFMPDKLLTFIVVSSVISIISKICRGKRAPKMNIFSGAIIFTGFTVLSAALVTFDNENAFDTFNKLFIAILLALSVILLINSSNLAERCIKMLGFSVLCVIFTGIHDTILHVIYTENIGNVIAYDFTAAFNDNECCAAFMIAMIPLFVVKHSVKSKVFTLISLTAVVLSLLLCNSYYAVLSLFIALVVFIILFRKFSNVATFFVTVCYGIISFIVPKLTSFILPEHLPRLEFLQRQSLISKATAEAFCKKFLLCGTGLGSESAVFATATDGMNISHISENTGIYSDIIMQLGLPLTIICIVVLWIFIARICSYAKSNNSSESAKGKCAALFTAICAMGIYAYFSDFLLDTKMLVLLFLILSLAVSVAESADNDYISDKANAAYKSMQ